MTQDFLDAIKALDLKIQMAIDQHAAALYRAMWRGEKDIDVLEKLADPLLHNCPESAEEDYRNFIEYIREFNPNIARNHEDLLDDLIGYKNHIIFAAAKLARELHKGQTDKGGNDYFTSHLLKVAETGTDIYEKTVGFLHDAAEDCGISEKEIILRLQQIMEDWMAHPDNYNDLIDEFDDLGFYPNEVYHPLRDDEWEMIEKALVALNHHRYPSREEYIENIKKNKLALKVKLNDLKSNMDLSRISSPTEKDLKRRERYGKEYETLLEALDVIC